MGKLQDVLYDAENAEKELSYQSQCGTERARKSTGSYYTPIDVARFFWNEYFCISKLERETDALKFIQESAFVEPSVGAGAMLFVFLEKLVRLGLSPALLADIEIDLVDVNWRSLRFVRKKINELGQAWNVKFPNIKFVCSDFRETRYPKSTKPVFFFGNPPFAPNERGSSKWKNLFADFLAIALDAAGPLGSIHFILPISIAFSRDYRDLRQRLSDQPRVVSLANFDNIPDSLFKAGKPKHYNSNKANSQRCSILTIRPSKKKIVLSTKLQRWSKKERETILGESPRYYDVTGYDFDDQIPRPQDQRVLDYLNDAEEAVSIQDICASVGKYTLHIAGVARNYIGIRETPGSGAHSISFTRHDDFLKALLLVSSDLFRDYWLTVGDGFHVTKANLYSFPVRGALIRELTASLPIARRIWKNRHQYSKIKRNSGRKTQSFDFSSVVPSLYVAFVV